ncbi:MAG: hypothetical protein KY468_09030 [Armatimonadetes bacterium]|nr:hypothetical protein [Armatimonadota bacterium]
MSERNRMGQDRQQDSSSGGDSRQNPPDSSGNSRGDSQRDSQGSSQGKSDQKEQKGRKLAEWISLGISVLLIAWIAGFLLFEAMQADGPHVLAEAKLLFDKMERKENTYILPMEVSNKGEHAIRSLRIQVTYDPPDGKEESRDVTLDYLGEGSTQEMYLYFQHDPKTLNVKADPQYYNLD